MRSLLLAGLVCTLFSCNSARNTASNGSGEMNSNAGNTSKDGWISLFDGKTLSGWHSYGKSAPGSAWVVDDGAIHLDASNKAGYQSNGGGDLVTDQSFKDFDLQLDWKISKDGNSGVIFYIHEDTARFDESWRSGPEIQVLDNAGHPDAKIYKHRAGDLYDLIASSPETVKPYGEWNHLEIKSLHGQLDVYLNNTHVLSTTMWNDEWKQLIAGSKFKNSPDFGSFREGKIALQDHGNDVWFKNIRIKRL